MIDIGYTMTSLYVKIESIFCDLRVKDLEVHSLFFHSFYI